MADLTTVAKLDNGKEMSNANVMYELGIARAYLGENRVIMLVDNAESVVEKLAFDINHSRITPFDRENQNFYKDLYKYIRKAIAYANNQRNILNYSMNEILSHLLVIYNNCYRLLCGYDEIVEIKEVKDNFKEEIRNRLFLEIQIYNNFESLITSMHESMRQIVNSDVFDQNYKIKLVELIKIIEHFCFVFQKNKSSFFTQMKGERSVTLLMDSCGTVLKVAEPNDEIDNSVFFRENTELFSLKEVPICDCFDKTCIKEFYSENRDVDVHMPDGLVTKLMNQKYYACDRYYRIHEEVVEIFSDLLVRIIHGIENVVQELGLIIKMEEDGKEQNYFSFHREREY